MDSGFDFKKEEGFLHTALLTTTPLTSHAILPHSVIAA